MYDRPVLHLQTGTFWTRGTDLVLVLVLLLLLLLHSSSPPVILLLRLILLLILLLILFLLFPNWSVSGLQIDGKNTQGENIADNGGLKESFRVFP